MKRKTQLWRQKRKCVISIKCWSNKWTSLLLQLVNKIEPDWSPTCYRCCHRWRFTLLWNIIHLLYIILTVVWMNKLTTLHIHKNNCFIEFADEQTLRYQKKKFCFLYPRFLGQKKLSSALQIWYKFFDGKNILIVDKYILEMLPIKKGYSCCFLFKILYIQNENERVLAFHL